MKMRGSTLIFHSLDPETLERISDLDSLDPESSEDERERYSELDARLQTNVQSEPIPNKLVTSTTNFNSDDSCDSSGRSSPIGFHRTPTDNLSQNSSPDQNGNSFLSCSPPLIKSHYHEEKIEKSIRNIKRTVDKSEMREKTLTPIIQAGSVLPLSRLRQTSHNFNVHSQEKDNQFQTASKNQKGFSRFLFFGQKDKQDKSRIDIYNLTPNLKEELKRIYVY